MLEDLERIALGELNLTPQEFGNYTITEIEALLDGYMTRQERIEDLLICMVTLPIYRGAYGKKAPTFAKLTEHRRRNKAKRLPEVDNETLLLWEDIQKRCKADEK